MLWVTWLFFNAAGASLGTNRYNSPAKIILVNYLSASAGGLVTVLLKPHFIGTYSSLHRFDISYLCNGIIVGLASATASCDCIEPWAGLLVGAIGSLFYIFGCYLMEKFEIDDPVEAAPLHFGGGLWGTLAVGIFNN